MVDGWSRTAVRMDRAGVDVVTIEYDGLHTNGGDVHCSTNRTGTRGQRRLKPTTVGRAD